MRVGGGWAETCWSQLRVKTVNERPHVSPGTHWWAIEWAYLRLRTAHISPKHVGRKVPPFRYQLVQDKWNVSTYNVKNIYEHIGWLRPQNLRSQQYLVGYYSVPNCSSDSCVFYIDLQSVNTTDPSGKAGRRIRKYQGIVVCWTVNGTDSHRTTGSTTVKLFELTLLPLNEAVTSTAAIVIVSSPDGRKRFWSQLNSSKR